MQDATLGRDRSSPYHPCRCSVAREAVADVDTRRDGTVTSPPRLLTPAPSAKQQPLMVSAVDALERCQPFTMLPREKYKQWKTMVLYVTPFAHW